MRSFPFNAKLFAALAAPLLFACGSPLANYPDASGVRAAQEEWCKSLAGSAGASWEHMSACKGAYPAASGAYLKGMGKCFSERREALGDEAPDNTQLLSDCNDEVTVAIRHDEAAAKELVDARCQRAERCEKVPRAECKAAFTRLETAQQVMLSTRYNQGALHKIADCLVSSSCEEDEDAARDACYAPLSEKLLWFPD